MIAFDDPAILDALERAVADTFEGIAFAQILEKKALTEPVKPGDDMLCSMLALVAPANLAFFMMMTRDHLKECFSQVNPGLDPDALPSAVLDDFINELTNTAAGHFMSICVPEKDDMVIGLPANPNDEQIKQSLTPGQACKVMLYKVEEDDLYCSLRPI